MKPLENIQKPGFIWKLRKLLYGLDVASRKFWLKVKEVFLDGDEAFYYLYEND